MRKLTISNTLLLFLVSLVAVILLCILFIYSRHNGTTVSLKVRSYHTEIVKSRLEEKNVKLLSAFDFCDGFITVTTTDIHHKSPPVYCHYFDKNRRPIPDTSKPISLFTKNTARCPKLGDPSFISLSYSFRKSPQLVPIPIKKRQFFEKRHDLTVCVEFEPKPNWLEISAFIEYHTNLGFSFFHFTTIDLDAYTRRIFDDYVRLGIVKLTSLRNSQGVLNNIDDVKTIQRTNCLFHARIDSRMVTFLRIDERVANISSFLESLSDENVTETRIVTNTVVQENILDRYLNESETRETLGYLNYKKHVQFRTVIDPNKMEGIGQISDDFIYRKASTFSPSIPETVTSSIIARVKYNYDTRPIYCDEFDINILSWCPLNLYHCQFRDEEDKRNILEKREEARKVKYQQETVQW